MPPLSNWHEIPGVFSSYVVPSVASSASTLNTARIRLDSTKPRGLIIVTLSAYKHHPLETYVKIYLPSKLTPPADLDLLVKSLYKSKKYAICRNSILWGGTMVSSPGLEYAYLFPKTFFKWYNYFDRLLHQNRWLAVNNPRNCILIDLLCHCLHKNRLLAVRRPSRKYKILNVWASFYFYVGLP